LGEGFSPAQKAEANFHPGRRTDGSQSEASWISDLTDLRKFIILCSFCRIRFNFRKHHYRKFYVQDQTRCTDGYAVNGICDSCKRPTANLGGGTGFISEESYSQICQDPVSAKRAERAKHYAVSIWQAINRR